MQLDGIAFGLPVLFFLLRTIIFAVYVADVMAAVAVGVGLQEGGAAAGTSTLYQTRCDFIYCANVLAIDRCAFNAEGCSATEDSSGGSLGEMRVLVVHIIFADVNNGQLPELREVHDLVERSLT